MILNNLKPLARLLLHIGVLTIKLPFTVPIRAVLRPTQSAVLS